MKNQITVLLFYKYVNINNPEADKVWWQERCSQFKGRIIIAFEGINATLAGDKLLIDEFMTELNNKYGEIEYKIDVEDKIPFKKMSVKTRPEIVTIDSGEGKIVNTAPKLNPEKFNKMTDESDVVILDARNKYESDIGKFKNAITPDISTFKEFKGFIDENLDQLENKKIVTYCTGGVRCERASAYMIEKGIKEVYQLDGGIVSYGKELKDSKESKWSGECFVFDERMKVGFSANPEKVGECVYCAGSSNDQKNCFNKQCNDLFVICEKCSIDYCKECNLAAVTS